MSAQEIVKYFYPMNEEAIAQHTKQELVEAIATLRKELERKRTEWSVSFTKLDESSHGFTTNATGQVILVEGACFVCLGEIGGYHVVLDEGEHYSPSQQDFFCETCLEYEVSE